MRAKIFLILVYFLTNLIMATSPLYIPREIKEAIANGTRTLDGKPGPNYWQNSADYSINAIVDVDSSKISGNCKITYYNNSPDTLKTVRFRIYQDILKKGAVRDWYIGSFELHDGVEINNLKVDEESYKLGRGNGEVQFSSTNMVVKLKQPLIPNSSAVIEMEWSFNVPKIIKVRMGNYSDGEMFIAYWYPQVAVYDDIDGWDRIDYAGSVEFYNDINNFEYNITLPDSFVVWGTGLLQNTDEVLHNSIVERINKAKQSDETVKIISQQDYESFDVVNKNGTNTWKFKADEVPDVSFCLSNNFNWDAQSVEVEPGRKVLTNVVYPEGKAHWDKAAEYSAMSVKYMSEELPGYPFPYPQVTSFCNKNRGGGMETPMMANNGAPEVLGRHVGLIFHEIAHNYFPFMMGTNERKYAFMDEGWASFFPNGLVDRVHEGYDSYSRRISAYESNAGKEGELPPMVLSFSNKSKSRTAAYDRPAVAYNELYELLGRDLFKEAMFNYIETWKGKHPLPIDFFRSFDNTAEEDLSWFWKPWFYEFGAPDLAIQSVEINEDVATINIEKAGKLPTGVFVTITYDDNTTEEIFEKSSVWKNGNSTFVIKHKTSKSISKVELGSRHIPDIDRSNNSFEIDSSQI